MGLSSGRYSSGAKPEPLIFRGAFLCLSLKNSHLKILLMQFKAPRNGSTSLLREACGCCAIQRDATAH